MLRPRQFPALQRLFVHLETFNRRYERDNGGAVPPIPSSDATDEGLLTWVKTSSAYKCFVNPCFDQQRTFTISVIVVFKGGWVELHSKDMVGHTSF
jgi:hypothetical protein